MDHTIQSYDHTFPGIVDHGRIFGDDKFGGIDFSSPWLSLLSIQQETLGVFPYGETFPSGRPAEFCLGRLCVAHTLVGPGIASIFFLPLPFHFSFSFLSSMDALALARPPLPHTRALPCACCWIPRCAPRLHRPRSGTTASRHDRSLLLPPAWKATLNSRAHEMQRHLCGAAMAMDGCCDQRRALAPDSQW